MTQPPARSRFFQRDWTWWFTLAVLATVAAARLHLLNLPLERDEGEYAYSGQLMLQGIPPYELAYTVKLPGTSAAYALIMALFGETPAGIHFGILCVTTLTALMLFRLGKKILDETAGMVAATTFAVLAASPFAFGFAGHATHFVAFFVTAGLSALWKARENPNWKMAAGTGLLFGLAILMKQPAALIALWAFADFFVRCLRQRQLPFGKKVLPVAAFGAGIILPFGLCCLLLWRAGVFGKFWFWTFDYARQYAGVVPFAMGLQFFWSNLCTVAGKSFLLWLIAAAGPGLIWFDERLRQTRPWIFGFCAASALALCPDFYFRNHYFILTMPAVALLAGCAVSGISKQKAGGWPVCAFALLLAATILANSGIWFAKTSAQTGRAIYGFDCFPEAEAAAAAIQKNSAPAARVAVLGSEPEIYFLSHRHSATGYIYVYGLMEPQPFARRMQDEMISEIETNAPEFVVFAENYLSWSREKNSDPGIFDWWDSYQTNYTRVWLADVISPSETKYVSGVEETARYGKLRTGGLEIYKRKPNTP